MRQEIKNAIVKALREAELEINEKTIQCVAEAMKSQKVSAEEAVLGIMEQAEQTQKVKYQGKTSEGYKSHMAQAAMQELFTLGNVGLQEDLEAVSDVSAELLAMGIQQNRANGTIYRKAAAILTGENTGQSAAYEEMMASIQAYKSQVFEELPAGGSDFFTKQLGSSFSPSKALEAATK